MTNESHVKPVEILLVEDNPGDARLVLEAFKDAGIGNPVRRVEDGEAALAYLRGRAPFLGTQRPGLILLDLNLPRKDGKEVLAEIKRDESLKTIPVIVLTTSKSEADIYKSYKLHANAYVAKPVDMDEFLAVVKGLGQFWLVIAKLPPHG